MGNCASSDQSHVSHERAFPMWVVKVSDAMAMSGVPQPHEVLQASGLLVKHRPGMFCIFVSHQWLSRHHPDPTGAQLKVLRQVLLGITSGSMALQSDIVTQFYKGNRKMLRAERDQILQGYLWLDWFSVPQDPDSASERRQAVQSIPSYVDVCGAFVALVPCLHHHDSGSLCDFETWLHRGWCRCELWCSQLSNHSRLPMITVNGPNDAEFAMPKDWVFAPADEGEFTVEEDRLAIKDVVQVSLQARVSFLDKHGEEPGLCRFLKGLRAKKFGQASSWPLDYFLSYFGFPNLQTAVKIKDMGALHCAAILDEPSLMRPLVEAKASVGAKCKSILTMDILRFAPLILAIQLNSLAAAKGLLMLRADPNSTCPEGLPPLGLCRSAEAVDFLLQHRADANQRVAPHMISPVAYVCSRTSPVEVVARLLERRANVNDSHGGHSKSPLTCTTLFSKATPRVSLAHAKLLLDARADVNQPGCTTGLFQMLELGSRLANCCGMDGPLLRYLAESSSTPLGFAALLNNRPLASLLLAARADPDIPNSRGHSPRQMASVEIRQLFDEPLALKEDPEDPVVVESL
ncbi:warA [Symbiodinium sp. CCMP2592]|nr:warA [Symbiodinium sp. CCMP2592]